MADRKRLLTDLRVIDLRAELEKRNLDKSGVRGVLIQRLSKYLEDEGHDPTTFRFDLSSPEQKSVPIKRTRRSVSAAEPDSEETPIMEDMIVQDDAGEEEEADLLQEDASQEVPDAPDVTDDTVNEESEEKLSRKRENQDDTEATQAKKTCVEKEEDHKTENNTDAEDSINLDLGEDELLNEETDSTAKHKKVIEMLHGIKMEGETERAALIERPALAQLIPGTDVDDAAIEDAAETASDGTATDSGAAATDATPADDLQVNADASATSNETENGDKEQKDAKGKTDDKKDKKDDAKEGGARNLWVSGLSGDTRAKDLKQLCSKHGKVIGAKVVTNARTPGSRCYGYVTMASAQDAENCIKNLHRTELHGRMISVEKAKSESESASRRQSSRYDRRSSKDDGKENEEGKDGDKTEKKKDDKDGDRSSSRTREKSHRSDKDRVRRNTRSRERRRSPREVLSFPRIWRSLRGEKERDMTRTRDRSRAAREEERRRRVAEEALRERERRQRQEKHRLALEREKLRAEREKIEREKNELLRLERERHRLEREKLELERLELKRAQLRLEEERRKRGYESAAYRKPVASPPPEPAYERERHKRVAPPPMSSNRGQFEAPPPPRFDVSNYDRNVDKRDRDRDYKREYPRHPSSANLKYPSNGSSNDDARQPIPPGTRIKEPSRSYESRDTRSYRPSPPSKPEPRNWNASSRYPDSTTTAKAGSGSGSTEAWSSSEPRYGSTYETRYQPAYQPPPPGAPYPDRYQPSRDYRKY